MADIDWNATGDFLKNRPAPSSGGGSDLKNRYPELYGEPSRETAPATPAPAAPAAPAPTAPAGGFMAGLMGLPDPALERLRAGRSNPEGPTAAEYNDMSWGEYLPKVASNVPSSTMNAIKGIGTAIVNPYATFIEGVGGTAFGLGSKAVDAASTALTGQSVYDDPRRKAHLERVADALIENYKNRYGGGEEGEAWKNLAEDPMAYAADLATVLSGGAGAASKLGAIDKAGAVAKGAQLASNLDPVQAAMNLAGKTATTVGKAVPYIPMATSKYATGLPFEVLKAAREVGLSGDPEKAAAFVSALKKNPNFNSDTAAQFEQAVKELEEQGRNEYLAGLQKSSLNKAEVDLSVPRFMRDQISDMVMPATGSDSGGIFLIPPYGKKDIVFAKSALQNFDEVFTHPNPAYRTIQYVDALKKNIRDLSTQIKNPNLRGHVQMLASDLSDQMNAIDPAYGKAMSAYQAMKDALFQTTKNFGSANLSDAQRAQRMSSLFKRGDADEIFRRIESTPSGKNLRYSLAGQAASPWLSDKAQNVIASAGGPGMLGYYLGSHPLAIPAAAAGLANASPRFAAGLQYNLGRAERNVNNAVSKAARTFAPPVITNLGSQFGYAMAPEYEEERAGQQAYGGRVERKTGGRVGIDHERLADQLVGAAERAKKGISKGTEQLLDMPDDHVAHALELANRSI